MKPKYEKPVMRVYKLSEDCLVVTATDEDGNVYTCKKPAPAGGFENGMFLRWRDDADEAGTRVITTGTQDVTLVDGEYVTGTGGANTHLMIETKDITSVTATSGSQYYAPIGKEEQYGLSLSGNTWTLTPQP